MISTIRKLWASLALGLALAVGFIPAAQAALSVVQTAGNTAASNPESATLSGAQSPGVIIAMVNANGDAATITVSDTVNGNYTQLADNDIPAIGTAAIFMVVTNGTGTPVITATSSNQAGMQIAVINVTGFVGTPTVDTAAALQANNPNSVTAITATPASNHNNEILAAVVHESTFFTGGGSPVSGWTLVAGAQAFFAINATPASTPFSGTLGSASSWVFQSVGVFDAPAGVPLLAAATDVTSATANITAPPAPFAPIPVNSGSNQINLGTGANSGTGDPLLTAFTKLQQDSNDVNSMVDQLYPVRSVQTPVTGFTITPAQGVTELILNPVGTLAAGTINMPANPGDGQPFSVLTSKTVTAITFTPASGQTLNGAPTTLTNTAEVKWIFEAALSTWFRVQ